jgi:hypothetical protein
MLIVIVVYCRLSFVVQSIIQPRLIGDAVGLSADGSAARHSRPPEGGGDTCRYHAETAQPDCCIPT